MRAIGAPLGLAGKRLGKIFLVVLLLFLTSLLILATQPPDKAAAGGGDAIAAAVPSIGTIDPDVAPRDWVVDISGTDFGAAQGSSYVTFGSTRAVEYPSWTSTLIQVKVPRITPAGPIDNVPVTVTTSGGTSNAVAFNLVQYAVSLAEGYTGNNFQEYLCIGSMQNVSVPATVAFLYADGSIDGTRVTVPPNSRVTLDVNVAAGAGEDVSVVVFSDLELVVERPMYFNYNGRWTGGHDVIATPYVSRAWFFAEGYTGPGFDEWVCVLNPSDAAANLTFHFQTKSSGEIDRTATVNPTSRKSFKVNDLLGNNLESSLFLESDQMIVAERPMYFDYRGRGGNHWEGGHCVMGLPFLSTEYSFAEGCTRSGFEQWLTMQNPSPETITVNAVYQLGPGQGNPVSKSYSVGPESRYTVYVADEVGANKDVSVKVSSDNYFLAERPMYFRYTGYGANYKGGHCVIGAISASDDWFFAEGYTGSGFQEWLCLQNSEDQDSNIEIDYLGKTGPIGAKLLTVPAKTRVSVRVNDSAGQNLELSCHIKVLSGSPIVAERPMYFNFRGWDGGHDVVGFYPESDVLASAGISAAQSKEAPLLRDQDFGWLR